VTAQVAHGVIDATPVLAGQSGNVGPGLDGVGDTLDAVGE